MVLLIPFLFSMVLFVPNGAGYGNGYASRDDRWYGVGGAQWGLTIRSV